MEDVDNLVLADYWQRLSKQAVLHGAGVVKLFFDEVEKEKRTKVLYDKNRPWVRRMLDGAGERLFGLADVLYGISAPYDPEALEAPDLSITPVPVGALPKPQLASAIESLSVDPAPDPQTVAPPPIAEIQPPLTNNSPVEPPVPPAVPVPPPPVRGGASTPNTPPSPPPPLTPVTPAAPADVTAPDVSLSITRCGDSLSPDGCLIATTTLTVIWSSAAEDLDHYVVECVKGGAACAGFAYSQTATTTAFIAEDNTSYTFRAKAVDRTGNESAFAEQAVEVNTMPVVINEIAWAGTADANSADEWIELNNRSAKTVSLTDWVLRSATDEKPYLNLSGTIPAGGYYLIERTDDSTVSNVAADLTAPFGSGVGMGLVDFGEALVLAHASTTVDQTPAVGACGFNAWCGGSAVTRSTMERVDPNLPGATPSSWGTNNGIIRNGVGASGNAINGTPKARNSLHYYISQTGSLAVDTTLSVARSPYFVGAGSFTVPSGVTLAINPGVVVKFYTNTSNLVVNGTLKVLGSAASEVVFTSFRDDSVGGDTNGDGGASAPAPGDWGAVTLNVASQNSEFSRTRFRYGGKWFASQSTGHALLKIDGSTASVSNSVFEQSLQSGIWLINSTSTIANSTIQSNAVDGLSYGILIEGGSPTLQGNALNANTIGIRVEGGGTATISGNAVASSTQEAISVVGSTPTLSANSASANGLNGVAISGSLVSDYTFSSNLPYVFEATLRLIAGRTFSAPAGAVFKGRTATAAISVEGAFAISGTADNPVVFTSLKDDAYGGDANSDGASSAPAAGDWRTVLFPATATSSAVNRAIVRYGGDQTFGAMSLESVGVDIADSTFEFNKFMGLRMSNASSTLSRLTIRNHTVGAEATGLKIESGSRTVIMNSSVVGNGSGIVATGGSTVANGGGNTFAGNTTDTVPAGLFP